MGAKILWVCVADPAKNMPIRYIMDTDGWPAIAYSGEVEKTNAWTFKKRGSQPSQGKRPRLLSCKP